MPIVIAKSSKLVEKKKKYRRWVRGFLFALGVVSIFYLLFSFWSLLLYFGAPAIVIGPLVYYVLVRRNNNQILETKPQKHDKSRVESGLETKFAMFARNFSLALVPMTTIAISTIWGYTYEARSCYEQVCSSLESNAHYWVTLVGTLISIPLTRQAIKRAEKQKVNKIVTDNSLLESPLTTIVLSLLSAIFFTIGFMYVSAIALLILL
jgi:hypothetical protein